MSSSGRLERGFDETVDRIDPDSLPMSTAPSGQPYFSDKVLVSAQELFRRDVEPPIDQEMCNILKPLDNSKDFLCLRPNDPRTPKVNMMKKKRGQDWPVGDFNDDFSDLKKYPMLPDITWDYNPPRRYWDYSDKRNSNVPRVWAPPQLFYSRLNQAHAEHQYQEQQEYAEIAPGSAIMVADDPESDDEEALEWSSLDKLARDRANHSLELYGEPTLEDRQRRKQYWADPEGWSQSDRLRMEEQLQGPNPMVGMFDKAEVHLAIEQVRQQQIRRLKKLKLPQDEVDNVVQRSLRMTAEELDSRADRAKQALQNSGKLPLPPLPKGVYKTPRKLAMGDEPQLWTPGPVQLSGGAFSTDAAKRDAQIDALLAAATGPIDETNEWLNFVSHVNSKNDPADCDAAKTLLALRTAATVAHDESTAVCALLEISSEWVEKEIPEPEPRPSDGADTISTPPIQHSWVQPSATPLASYGRARSARQRQLPLRYRN